MGAFQRQTQASESLGPFLLPPSKAYKAIVTHFLTATQHNAQRHPETGERVKDALEGTALTLAPAHIPITGQEHLFCFDCFSPDTSLHAGALLVSSVSRGLIS